ncbi:MULTISPECIES: glycosyltransferase [Falsihalocynthiibacter]|uniref:glycosyltransferase n=1 Tax=Falsihalocynthiibacter TaxID=2854182 RepID=UPI003002E597
MSDRTRVLLLTSKLSPAAGGLAVSVPGLAHSIDPFDDMEMHVMGTIDPSYPDAAQTWGPRVHAFPVSGPAPWQYARGMGAAIEKLNPDLIDVQGLWTYPSYANLKQARTTHTPYIVTPRGMLDPWARNNSHLKKRIAAAIFENAHLRGARCLRATAEMEAQHFRDMGLSNPIAIVPNAMALPELATRTEGPLRQVLFLSRLHPKKGIDLLLKSWSTLTARFPDWELVIAGIDEGGHEADMKLLAAKLKLERVRFVGAKHGAEKEMQYRNADLFVLPTHAENFGLVVAEALAQETPVITTKNAPWAGLQEHDCGWWIELSQDELTETMQQAMSTGPEVLKEMGRRGRKWVERDFGREEVASRMRDVYLWITRGTQKPDHVHD